MSKRFLHLIRQMALLTTFTGSRSYWETRYRLGGDSGAGSFGQLANFKAEVLNQFVHDHAVTSIVEFGVGDGNQLALTEFPRYLGLDVSRTAIVKCSQRFRSDTRKSFLWYDPVCTSNIGQFLKADLCLSLDVIYHLVEDEIYEAYLANLFSAAIRFVIIYSTDEDRACTIPHVRHRCFSKDVAQLAPGFRLVDRIVNRFPSNSACDFFIFERSQ